MNEQGTSAIIHETAGRIYLSEQKYQRAYRELQQAFERYSQQGQNAQALNALQYLYITSILANSQIDPGVLNETNVYKSLDQIQSLS